MSAPIVDAALRLAATDVLEQLVDEGKAVRHVADDGQVSYSKAEA